MHSLQERLTPQERRRQRLEEVAKDLRAGRRVTDFRFDQVYAADIRNLSATHWTPVEVAIRAAELLVTSDRTRVLDVGAGSGKFCIVGSLASRGLFVGVEQRPHLAEFARKAADDLEADQASFVTGNMIELDWGLFDAIYLFNPFYENVMKDIRIDSLVSHSQEKFRRYVEVVRAKLAEARAGTRVATYHGFGGDIPQGYDLLHREPICTNSIEVWIKRNSKPPAQ